MDKKHIANVVRVVFAVISLLVAWQAVRFCEGNIGVPIVDQIKTIFEILLPGSDEAPFVNPFRMFDKCAYFIFGIGVWIGFGIFCICIGNGVARIVEIGFSQYIAECKKAEEEAQHSVKTNGSKLRRKPRKGQQPLSPFGIGTLVLGVLIGKIL